jgi:hypothetical protein
LTLQKTEKAVFAILASPCLPSLLSGQTSCDRSRSILSLFDSAFHTRFEDSHSSGQQPNRPLTGLFICGHAHSRPADRICTDVQPQSIADRCIIQLSFVAVHAQACP